MKKYLLFLFLFFIQLFAYDSIEVLTPNITLHKSGYFKTDKDLSAKQALKIANETNLTVLPKESYALRLTSDTVWFVFEVSTKGTENLYLDSRDIFVGSTYDLFVFSGDKLIKSYKNGSSIAVDKRDIKTQQIRFLLEPNSANITYLVRAKNVHPLLPVFSFGNFEEISAVWTNLHNTMLISYFIALSFLLYNMMLYLITRDKSFAYYCFYISSLFLVCISGRPYLPFDIAIDPKQMYALLAISLATTSIGAALFAHSFLNLKERLPSISRTLNISISVFAILAPTSYYFNFMPIKILFLFSLVHISVYIFYAAFKVYKAGYITGLYFMLSTGGGIFLIQLYMVAFYVPNLLPITTWSITLVHQAVVWDVIMLSIALAYRIKLLQTEREQAQRLIAHKARFATIGETIGNIAHQWRQPLAELSATVTSLEIHKRFGNGVDEAKLEESLASISKTVKYLSSTINTFQVFFHQGTDGSFNIKTCVNNALVFMQGQFESHDIQINLYCEGNTTVKGDEDKFFQVLLIILNNAKDAIVEHKTKNPLIDIKILDNGSEVTITVQDNAGGISFQNKDKIFEPYVSTKGLNGMGIGLYFAKNIIEERMKGSIKAKNTSDGALFEIVLKSISTQ